MTSNCALIALTAGSSGRRCSDSTVSSASAERGEALARSDSRPAADPDQRRGEHGDHDDGEQDAEQHEHVGVAHASPYPSVSAFI